MHLMQIPDTPRARLVDLLLREATGEGATEAILRLRGENQTWAQVSDYLTTATGVVIGREGVRLWRVDVPERVRDAAA